MSRRGRVARPEVERNEYGEYSMGLESRKKISLRDIVVAFFILVITGVMAGVLVQGFLSF